MPLYTVENSSWQQVVLIQVPVFGVQVASQLWLIDAHIRMSNLFQYQI